MRKACSVARWDNGRHSCSLLTTHHPTMIIHHPDIKEMNKFLTHGIRLLRHLEK